MRLSIFAQSLVLAAATALPGLAASGADTFKTNCVLCHGEDGSGATPVGQQMKVRDLRSADVQKQPDAVLIKLVSDGKNAMPPFGTTLSSQEIKDVIKYVRRFAVKGK